MERKLTREVNIGGLRMGGTNPVIIQSMCNTDTRDVEATVKQILALEEAGCELVRVAIPDMVAADAVGEIKKQIHIPLVADIHFDYRLALRVMELGIDKVRINPGNIGDEDKIKQVVDMAKEMGYNHLYFSTYNVLNAARTMYRSLGFIITKETPEEEVAPGVIEEIWEKDI